MARADEDASRFVSYWIETEEIIEKSFKNIPTEYSSVVPKPIPINPRINIYIDYSNISVGIGRIDGNKLLKFVENGRDTDEKIIAGKKLPEDSIKVWEHHGYRCRNFIIQGKEQAVDEFIHAQILTKASQANEIITVVIVTGDGNDNEGFSNFIRVAEVCLAKNYFVEIVSWQNRLSKRYYALRERFPDLVRIRYLDNSILL